jgi:hypothetical protein
MTRLGRSLVAALKQQGTAALHSGSRAAVLSCLRAANSVSPNAIGLHNDLVGAGPLAAHKQQGTAALLSQRTAALL